jgi:hypothetical protein
MFLVIIAEGKNGYKVCNYRPKESTHTIIVSDVKFDLNLNVEIPKDWPFNLAHVGAWFDECKLDSVQKVQDNRGFFGPSSLHQAVLLSSVDSSTFYSKTCKEHHFLIHYQGLDGDKEYKYVVTLEHITAEQLHKNDAFGEPRERFFASSKKVRALHPDCVLGFKTFAKFINHFEWKGYAFFQGCIENKDTYNCWTASNKFMKTFPEATQKQIHKYGIALRVAKNAEVARILIEKGADKDAADNRGCTALHQAANAEVAKFLIESGADKEAKDNFGRTALHNAVIRNSAKHVRILNEKGADKEATDNKGRTALHHAMLLDSAEVARILIEKGANKEAKDKYGPAAFDESKIDHTEVARSVIDREADKIADKEEDKYDKNNGRNSIFHDTYEKDHTMIEIIKFAIKNIKFLISFSIIFISICVFLTK